LLKHCQKQSPVKDHCYAGMEVQYCPILTFSRKAVNLHFHIKSSNSQMLITNPLIKTEQNTASTHL
jgi:hypothetical protein